MLCVLVGTNEGGDLESGKAVFSDPTEVFIEGKGIFYEIILPFYPK